MSVVPFTTQAGHRIVTQSSQCGYKMVLVHTDRMTERQLFVMRDCQNRLAHHVETVVCSISDLDQIPLTHKYFVIPIYNQDLVEKIRKRFEKVCGRSLIYLPRAVIEARTCFGVPLPVRSLAVSLSMYKCHVFLVKSCAEEDTRRKINEMCGTIVSSFSDSKLNVVVTNRADNKYCLKAMKRNVPVVSQDWIDENYHIASEEGEAFFNHDALTKITEHTIKPFYGLHFKIDAKISAPEIKKIILENQGHVVYGNQKCLTHIVAEPGYLSNSSDNLGGSDKSRPKIVDIGFLSRCSSLGYYVAKKDYRETPNQQSISGVSIKQERRSPPLGQVEENFTPTILSPVISTNNNIDNRTAMLPPPTPRSIKRHQQQAENDALMNKALSSIETAPTQRVSTQMRRLPEPELRIEQTVEPSQHLYWNDSVSRRNF